MNKNNKKKTAVAAMALTLIVGAGSMAYFTDQKFGGVTATAGNVSLAEPGFIADDGLFVPGDDIPMKALETAKYTGNVNARYRIRASFESMNKAGLEYSTDIDEPGFHLIDGEGKVVELGDETKFGHLIDSGTLEYSEDGENKINIGGKDGYKLHINEATTNDLQGKYIGASLTIQVLQEGNTNADWITLDNQIIEIVAK